MKYTIMYRDIEDIRVIVYFFWRKKLYKILKRMVLFFTAVALFAGTLSISSKEIYAKATAPSLKNSSWTLYLDGCGVKDVNTDKSGYYSFVNVRKLLKDFSKSKYDITLKSGDKSIVSVSSKKDRIYAKGLGKTKVTVKVKNLSDKKNVFKGTLSVVVKNKPVETEPKKEPKARQLSSDMVELSGIFDEEEDEDPYAEDFTVYEENDGVQIFFSYVSKVVFDGEKAKVTLFKPFESGKLYTLKYNGSSCSFVSGNCGIEDVVRFEIAEESIHIGETKTFRLKYFNGEGLDITAAVKDTLDEKVTLGFTDKIYYRYASVSGRKVRANGKTDAIEVSAELKFKPGNERVETKLSTDKVITVLPEKTPEFTGNNVYTIKKETKKYMTWGETCQSNVPLGDSVVFEALFEFDDGTVKSLKDAGIDEVRSADPSIVMISTEAKNGGYNLLLNREGETSVICFKKGEAIAGFDIQVMPKRAPESIRLELDRDHLNTNALVNDYIIIKADIIDQYGDEIEAGEISIKQDEINIEEVGAISFNKIAEGRFVVYGSDCPVTKEESVVIAYVSGAGYTSEALFYIKDVEYDKGYGDFEYKLDLDGPRLLDTALGIREEAPKSTFVTVKISRENYYVDEGIGVLLKDKPENISESTIKNYISKGRIYGITVEYESENRDKRFITKEENCVIPAYMELEFVPYMWNEQLPSGKYTITVYRFVLFDGDVYCDECDSVTLIAIDSDPEVEVFQTAQDYSGTVKDWKTEISKFFTFEFKGEDISGYITKVDRVEDADGSVFVKSVEFSLKDPYYGPFTKKVDIDRLITKQ